MSTIFPPGLLGSHNGHSTANSTPAPDVPDIEKFGLKGISLLVKMEQKDITTSAMGQDLGLMGLDLGDELEILKSLASPWQETSRSEVEPYFSLHELILQKNIQPPPEPCDTKILSFMDETLFYIFYTKPRDTLQEYAARELVARNWRYHRDIQVWLTKDSNVEPVLISPDVERGVYIFFDPHNWEKIRKEFVLHYSSVQA